MVYGADGLDELTTTDKTFVSEVKAGVLKDYEITPEEFGIPRAKPDDLSGGCIEENVKIIRYVLEAGEGPARDIVLLNSGCAIYAADKADTIAEGIKLAEKSIDSKAALKKLELLKEYSHG